MSFILRDLDNPLIKRGMTTQFATRRTRIAAGEKPLGWKVGMGAPASMQKLGLQAPLVGYLMQRALLAPGSTVSLKGYSKPVMEPEIAVRMAHDLAARRDGRRGGRGDQGDRAGDRNRRSRSGADAGQSRPVLADDIFQRHVAVAAAARAGSATSGLTSRLIRRGAEAARSTDPEALTGKLLDIVAHVANVVAAFGEKLSAGDLIITGSITPPVFIEPDETEIAHAIDPIGAVSVRFSRD